MPTLHWAAIIRHKCLAWQCLGHTASLQTIWLKTTRCKCLTNLHWAAIRHKCLAWQCLGHTTSLQIIWLKTTRCKCITLHWAAIRHKCLAWQCLGNTSLLQHKAWWQLLAGQTTAWIRHHLLPVETMRGQKLSQLLGNTWQILNHWCNCLVQPMSFTYQKLML